MKKILIGFFGIIGVYFAMLLLAPKPIVVEKWIEPTQVQPLVYEIDVNGQIKLVKYAFLDVQDYVLKVQGNETYCIYVDSAIWYNARIGTAIKGTYPKFDYSIYQLKPPVNNNLNNN